MPQDERTGFRDQSFSAFHRADSISRFTENDKIAKQLTLIDMDASWWIESDPISREPLALFELAQYHGKPSYKPAPVLGTLGERAGVPVYVIQYKTGDEANPANPGSKDIVEFHVRRDFGFMDPRNEEKNVTLTPQRFVDWLIEVRARGIARIERERAEKAAAGEKDGKGE